MTRLVSPGEYYESGRSAWMYLPPMVPTNSADWLPSRTSDMVICDHAFGLPLNYDKTAKRVRQQYDNNTTPRIRGLRHIWTTFEAQDFQGLPDLEWGGLETHPLGCGCLLYGAGCHAASMTCACFPAPHGDESADSSALVPACAGGLSPAIVSFGSSIHSVWLVLRVAPSHHESQSRPPRHSSDETGIVWEPEGLG